MSTVRIECPDCGQPVELPDEVARRGLNCPECFKYFMPVLPPAPEPPATIPSAPARPINKNEPNAQAPANTLEYSIWEQAWRFTSAAVIFAIIGLLALVFGVIAEIGGNSSGICWIVMAATLTTAFWLYLIAQILHIRALLTKK